MELLEKIHQKKAVVGVVGLGYVGLPLLMEFVEQGFKTLGFDIDQKKVDKLNAGKSYIKHIDEKRVKAVRDSKLFEATSDFGRIKEVD
ncbi:MAG TPA: nucleotide sugar dehydrogenase, partial [Caldithrix abyssi]|nr:nucleotide sugar dehydrogenase [Caldithrix abyssi]